MATYAIGDLQGCYSALQMLLQRLEFDPQRDRLWLAGDLVNRGPQSLQVLRFVRSLGSAAVVVLGNHDLHLLARAWGGRAGRRDTLDELLSATDRNELLDWLRHQPLLHVGSGDTAGWAMVHASLPPSWSIGEAQRMANEVHSALVGNDPGRFLREMYGDEPRIWTPALHGLRRKRYAVNAFTRARYFEASGIMDLRHKNAPAQTSPELIPWFALPDRKSRDTRIVFGHWSTLGKVHWPEHRVWGLDTGAVWGGKLTALNLDTQELTQVDCASHRKPCEEIGD